MRGSCVWGAEVRPSKGSLEEDNRRHFRQGRESRAAVMGRQDLPQSVGCRAEILTWDLLSCYSLVVLGKENRTDSVSRELVFSATTYPTYGRIILD